MKFAPLVAFKGLLSLSAAKIQVFNPDTLRQSIADPAGMIEAGLANFGHIEYGTSFVSGTLQPKLQKA